MEIEDQVCSLELAKKLKELGIKQDSIFDWVLNNHKPDYYLWLMSPYNRENLRFKDQYSAFTVAELGEMLPETLYDENDKYINIITIFKENDIWTCAYHYDFSCPPRFSFRDFNFADCLAKMLIYLVENKLIDLKGD